MSLLSVVGCQVEVSTKGRSLVQMSLTECGVIEELHRECLGPLAVSSHEKKNNKRKRSYGTLCTYTSPSGSQIVFRYDQHGRQFYVRIVDLKIVAQVAIYFL
jgi:hypothetical protein